MPTPSAETQFKIDKTDQGSKNESEGGDKGMSYTSSVTQSTAQEKNSGDGVTQQSVASGVNEGPLRTEAQSSDAVESKKLV